MRRAAHLSPQKRRDRSDLVRLSIFVTFALVVTLWVAAVTGETRPGARAEYRAVFGDVSGLAEGDAVRIAGVEVGTVTRIDVRPDSTVLVAFDVREGQELTTATEATIQYRNLLGDRVLQLSRGAADRGRPLAVGATIARERTASALDLDTLLNGFKPLFAGLNPTQVNELSGQLLQVLQGQQASVATLVEHVASFTTAIGDREQLVGQVVRNLNSVLGTVDARRGTVGLLLDRLSALVSGLDRQDDQVLDAAADIGVLAERASRLVVGARVDLVSDLRGLETSAEGINADAATLDRVLKKLPGHYDRIQNAASYGNYFNFVLCGVRLQTGINPDKPVLTPWIRSSLARCR